MRRAFDTLHIHGTVVIGEGERDEAPMLYIGEKVGRSAPTAIRAVDIALDPLEGTNLCAYGRPGAIAVVAIAEPGQPAQRARTRTWRSSPWGPAPAARSTCASAHREPHAPSREAMGRDVEDLTVVILDRPRHEELIREVRAAGARIRLIEDGDVAGAVATCFDETGVDVLMGIGGAPEGVIAAAAVSCVGGDMQGRLMPRNDDEIVRAQEDGHHGHQPDLHRRGAGPGRGDVRRHRRHHRRLPARACASSAAAARRTRW